MIHRSCLLIAVAAVLLAGCAAPVSYVDPAAPVRGANTKLIAAPIDVVWARSVPQLGKQYFVINTIDKSSGLINVSYAGDPARYVDCGMMTVGDQQISGVQSRAVHRSTIAGPPTMVYRKMHLDGRMNLVFEADGAASTRVTVNARYSVTRELEARNAFSNILMAQDRSTVQLNTGGQARFPALNNGPALLCVPTGDLEREVLELIY